jgi:hypothetical protein
VAAPIASDTIPTTGVVTRSSVPHHRYEDEDNLENARTDEALHKSKHPRTDENDKENKITFDLELPTHHLYLGEQEDVSCNATFPSRDDGPFVVPVLPLHDVVLFPGELLPMRIFDPVYVPLLEQMVHEGDRPNLIGVIAMKSRMRQRAKPDEEGNIDLTSHWGKVGTIAQIRYVKKGT